VNDKPNEKRKNQLAAAISIIGENGAPDIYLGDVNFKIVDRKYGWIAGVIKNQTGERIGKCEIEGIDLGQFSLSKSPGRPASDDKHLAVLLAWAQICNELGGKRGEADNQTAKLFGYSDGKKVMDIRQRLAKQHGIDFDNCMFVIPENSPQESGSPPCSILISKPTFYKQEEQGLEILGVGTFWLKSWSAQVAKGRCVRLELPDFESTDEFDSWKAKGGPIIISIIRPGR